MSIFSGNAYHRYLMVGAAAIVASAVATPAMAQARTFKVAAQPASRGIPDFAKQAGIQILASGDVVKGKRTKAVKGSYSVEEGLRILLQGTGLVASSGNGTGIVTIRRAAVVSTSTEASAAQPKGKSIAEPAEANAPEDQEIVVTGTNIRGEAPVGQSLTIIDRKEIERTGYSSSQDIIRALPQNFGADARDNFLTVAGSSQPFDGNSASSRSPNLRGLGTGSTLTLLDGRRLAPGGSFGGVTDISIIPVSAIERIEVLTDGASALYGADAVGGVVNFILRKDYEGAETTLRFGGSPSGSWRDFQASQAIGAKWSTGSVVGTIDYTRSLPLKGIERELNGGDFRVYGGTDRRSNQCNPGNIVISGISYAIPSNQNGTALPANTLIAGTTNLCSPLGQTPLTPDLKRVSSTISARQQVGEKVTLLADLLFAYRENKVEQPNRVSVTVPSTNPFYVNPTGGTGPILVRYDFTDDLGPLTSSVKARSVSASFGVSYKFGQDWTLTGYTSPGIQRERSFSKLNPERASRNLALADSNPATALNVFGDGSNTNTATLASLANTTTFRRNADSQFWISNITANGSLLALPGGDIKMAIGAEHQSLELDGFADFIETIGGTRRLSETMTSRTIKAAFGEIYLPIIGAGNAREGLERLAISFAGRYEDYSDFGSAFSPRVGAVLEPTNGFSIRASWAKSFRAPYLPQLSEALNSSLVFNLPDPQSPTGTSDVLIRSGSGNADLQPEKAETWSVGIDLAPPPVPNLRVSASYFNISYRGRIGNPSGGFSLSSANDPYITRAITPQQRQSICSSTVFSGNFSGQPGDCLRAPTTVILDLIIDNIAELRQSGLDANISYSSSIGSGEIYGSISATQLFNMDIKSTPVSSTISVLDTVGDPLNFRARASLGFSHSGFDITMFVNYSDSYKNELVNPIRKVAAWTTFDVNLGYQFSTQSAWLKGVSISLNARNLFDKRSPFVEDGSLFAGYDPANGDITGRYMSLVLRKKW
jgi:iron complex outermembrane recepter protein